MGGIEQGQRMSRRTLLQYGADATGLIPFSLGNKNLIQDAADLARYPVKAVKLSYQEQKNLILNTADLARDPAQAVELAKDHMGEWFQDANTARKMAAAIMQHPGRVPAAIELWRGEPQTFKDSPFFRKSFEYRKGASNRVVGFGDSNMVGAYGSDTYFSPASVYHRNVTSYMPAGDWGETAFIFANGGATTLDVIERQLPSAEPILNRIDRFDILTSTGGDDPIELIRSPHDAERLKRLADDPFQHPDIYLEFAENMRRSRSELRSHITSLLKILAQVHGSHIGHFGMMMLPDVRYANKITTRRVGDKRYDLNLFNEHTRRIAGNLATAINNDITEVLTEVDPEMPFSIVGINTYKVRNFAQDQHFTEQGVVELVNTVYPDRVKFAA